MGNLLGSHHYNKFYLIINIFYSENETTYKILQDEIISLPAMQAKSYRLSPNIVAYIFSPIWILCFYSFYALLIFFKEVA
jgi:hypothetical protein